ncbi:hypothetical protein ElyMa_003771600 [Elysia marginata]|uniref:Uncharacterized protein n=1 Tax=Elysia marginata TaxID=1093978 RepID=A0AAV4F9F1_9GAST|nr:hypothetical protein ElyMa_003771600 [Elysia marginata]
MPALLKCTRFSSLLCPPDVDKRQDVRPRDLATLLPTEDLESCVVPCEGCPVTNGLFQQILLCARDWQTSRLGETSQARTKIKGSFCLGVPIISSTYSQVDWQSV